MFSSKERLLLGTKTHINSWFVFLQPKLGLLPHKEGPPPPGLHVAALLFCAELLTVAVEFVVCSCGCL